MNIKPRDIVVSSLVIGIVLLLLIPLPTWAMDVALIINIALSLIVLLYTLYVKEALDFSIFPSLLLVLTIYAIALNINSTRLILATGYAGAVIETFGNFIAAGNFVVGIIIFIILVLVQFLVITKGAERVSEVAARFTLDAMPGKQMAIDADLNSGVIDEQTARERRSKVQREADFYGAMDGASKFVKGNAILGIMVTLINIVGGIIIGVTMMGRDIGEVATTFTMLTIGDGLVSQIPQLLISTSMGIIVTRSVSENNFASDLTAQAGSQPVVLMIAGGALILLGFIPGMPFLFTFVVGGLLLVLGALMSRRLQVAEVPVSEEEHIEELAEETRKPENVVSLLQVDPIELEFGYGIIPLADAQQGGDLLDRVVMIRRQCAIELGMIVPVIRLRDNIQLQSNEYVIKIKGNEVAHGEVMIDHFMVMSAAGEVENLDGVPTTEPAFGLPAIWITSKQREKAEIMGYTIVDPPSVIATHLTEVLRRHGHELLGRQQVQVLMDNLKQSQPALVDEVVGKLFSLGEIQKVLGNLLRESVSIRDMGTIIETLGDYGGITRDPDLLTEYVRQNLKRTITRRFVPETRARVITLDPNLEQLIMDHIKQTERGSYLTLDNNTIQRIFLNLRSAVEKIGALGVTPIVMTSPVVRMHFKRLVEQVAPDLVVLSYAEIEQDVDIEADGVVGL